MERVLWGCFGVALGGPKSCWSSEQVFAAKGAGDWCEGGLLRIPRFDSRTNTVVDSKCNFYGRIWTPSLLAMARAYPWSGCLVGWLVGRSVAWLVGRSVGRSVG